MLEEAQNKRHPVLERLRFLSISASNLDEFYMVRAAGIYGQIVAGVTTLTQDGAHAASSSSPRSTDFAAEPGRRQAGVLERAQEGHGRGRHAHRRAGGRRRQTSAPGCERLFMTHVFPILTPIAVDPAHPFPFILNKGLTARRLDAPQVRRQDA